MHINEEELLLQKNSIKQYIALQEVNQQVLDSLPSNQLTREMLSNYVNHACFGTPGQNYQKKLEGRYIEGLSTSILFGITGCIGGIFLAAPATVLGSLLLKSHIINKVYSTLQLKLNQEVIIKSAKFYFDNAANIDASFDSLYFSKLAKQSNLTNKDLLEAYNKIFSYYHDLVMSYDAMHLNIDSSTSQKPGVNKDKACQLDNSDINASDLIISDDILFNLVELEKLSSTKGGITEIEILATISVLEEELDTGTDIIRVERISNEILPKLRKALDYKQNINN